MNARTVFKVLALVGVPVTGYLASRGSGIKAKRIKEHGPAMTIKDKVVENGISYGPAIIAGAATMISIAASDKLATKAIAAATATATAAIAKKDVLKGQFEKYRGAVKEDQGEKKDAEYMVKASEIKLDDNGEVVRTFKLDWLPGEPIIFQASMADVYEGINNINRHIADYANCSGVVTVSDALDFFKHKELANSKTNIAGWDASLLARECDCYFLDFFIYPEGQRMFSHGDEPVDVWCIDVGWGPWENLGYAVRQAIEAGVL